MRRIKAESKASIFDTACGVISGSILAGGILLPFVQTEKEVPAETWIVVGLVATIYFLLGMIGRWFTCFGFASFGAFLGWVLGAGLTESLWGPYCSAFAGAFCSYLAAAAVVVIREHYTWKLRQGDHYDVQGQVRQRNLHDL